MAIMENANKYAELIENITEEQREEYSEENPIFHAEQGPNRFATMSLFFNETEGVTITEDLELNEITIEFFNGKENVEIVEGALYRWALKFFNENWSN